MKLQQREMERTGITSLKIGFNNVFGYYIEVRNTHKDKVPEEWIRKQTLVSAERYITEELKEIETKILNAEDKIKTLEYDLFMKVVDRTVEEIFQLKYPLGSVGIFVGRHPADGGFVHTDVFSHIPQDHGFEVGDAMFEKISLKFQDAFHHFVDGFLALMNTSD